MVLTAGQDYWWFLGSKLCLLQCQRYIHCKITAREGQWPVTSFFPLICLPSSLCPTPDSWDLQSICQRSLEKVPLSLLSCPLAVICESSVGCSSCYSCILAGWTNMQPRGKYSQWAYTVYVLGRRFVLSELNRSPIQYETLGYSETSNNWILNWSTSEFLMWLACSPSSLCSCETQATVLLPPGWEVCKFLSVHMMGGAISDLWVLGTINITCQDPSWLSSGISKVPWCLVLSACKKGWQVKLVRISTVHASPSAGGKGTLQNRPALTLWPQPDS